MGKEIPEDIIGPESAPAAKSIGGEGMKMPTQSFEAFMQPKAAETPAGKPAGISPFDLPAGAAMPTVQPTMDSLLAQMQATSGVLGDVQQKLNTKNLRLKQSQKYLLRNKLTEVNGQIRTAAAKVGVDVGEPPSLLNRQSPIAKFIALVNDGVEQLNGASALINNLKMKGESLSPGDMLLVQIKISKAQQELEYTSVLLSKAVDDIKMLFNVQI